MAGPASTADDASGRRQTTAGSYASSPRAAFSRAAGTTAPAKPSPPSTPDSSKRCMTMAGPAPAASAAFSKRRETMAGPSPAKPASRLICLLTGKCPPAVGLPACTLPPLYALSLVHRHHWQPSSARADASPLRPPPCASPCPSAGKRDPTSSSSTSSWTIRSAAAAPQNTCTGKCSPRCPAACLCAVPWARPCLCTAPKQQASALWPDTPTLPHPPSPSLTLDLPCPSLLALQR